MHRHLVSVIAVGLACVTGFAGADDVASSWPEKGSTIYISFTLVGVIQDPVPAFAQMGVAYDPPVPLDRKVCRQAKFCWYFIPPCEPVRVYQSKLRLALEDSYSARLLLEGDFSAWIHRSQDACVASVGAKPKPRLRYRDFALRPLGTDEEPAQDRFSVSIGGPLKPAGVVEIDATPPEPPDVLARPLVDTDSHTPSEEP